MRCNRIPRNHSSGFSLVEILISVAIIGTFFLSASGVFMLISKNIQVTRMKTVANNFAQERIESLKSVPYARLRATSDEDLQKFGYDTENYPPETVTVGGTKYERRVTVTHVAKDGSKNQFIAVANQAVESDIKKISTEVRWMDGKYQKSLILSNLRENPSRIPLSGTLEATVYVINFPGGPPTPMSGALVEVKENPLWKASSAGGGKCTIRVSSGTYTVRASCFGLFTPQELSGIKVDAGQTRAISFTLPKSQCRTVTAQAYCHDHVVISEICANTGDGTEFVELYNPTSYYMNLDGRFSLTFKGAKLTNGSGNPVWGGWEGAVVGANRTIPEGNIPWPGHFPATMNYRYLVMVSTFIPPYGYYLVANRDTVNFYGGKKHPNYLCRADAYYSSASSPLDLIKETLDINDPRYNYSWNDPVDSFRAGSIMVTVPNGFGVLTADAFGWATIGYQNPAQLIESAEAGARIDYEGVPALRPWFCSGTLQYRKTGAYSSGRVYGYSNDTDMSGGADGGYADWSSPGLFTQYDDTNEYFPRNSSPDYKQAPSGRSFATSASDLLTESTCYVLANDGLSRPTKVTNAYGGFTMDMSTGTWDVTLFYLKSTRSGLKLARNYTMITNVKIPTGSGTMSIPTTTSVPRSRPGSYGGSCFIDDPLPPQTGLVAGYIRDGKGPVANLVVTAGTKEVRTASDGLYVFHLPTSAMPQRITVNPQSNPYFNPDYVETSRDVMVPDREVAAADFYVSPGGSIAGRIVSNSGEKIPNVTVVAIKKDTDLEAGAAYSDTDGIFLIDSIPEGNYIVKPILERGENYETLPANIAMNVPREVQVTKGMTTWTDVQNNFSSFTVVSAFAYLKGTVTSGGKPLETGAIIMASTSTTFASAPPATFDAGVRQGSTLYYSTVSNPDGTYELAVRDMDQSYTIYCWYTSLCAGGTPTIMRAKSTVADSPSSNTIKAGKFTTVPPITF